MDNKKIIGLIIVIAIMLIITFLIGPSLIWIFAIIVGVIMMGVLIFFTLWNTSKEEINELYRKDIYKRDEPKDINK